MRIGLSELLVIIVLAIALFSPEKLPVYTKKFSEAMQQIKKCASDAKEVAQPVQDVKETVDAQVESFANSQLAQVTDIVKESGKEE